MLAGYPSDQATPEMLPSDCGGGRMMASNLSAECDRAAVAKGDAVRECDIAQKSRTVDP